MTVIVKDKETKMDKGLIMWAVFAAVFAAGVLINRVIKKGAENGIEADAIVSRIVDDFGDLCSDIGVIRSNHLESPIRSRRGTARRYQVQSEDENQCETGLMVLGGICVKRFGTL